MYLHQPHRETAVTQKLLSIHFAAAAGILLVVAVLVGPVAWKLDFRQGKAAIPLRKPLSAMNVDLLRPYKVVERVTLDPVVVEALGTDQYINWRLQDTSAAPSDPLRDILLFITYDTGGQNMVPHTPDECRLGAGYQQAQAHENREIDVDSAGAQHKLPLRVCTFVKTAVFNRMEQTVVYLFHSNGDYTATREGVRVLFNDPRDRFGYFSKVEISFPNAGRDESVRGAARLLGKLMPILESEHFPDFAAANASAAVQ